MSIPVDTDPELEARSSAARSLDGLAETAADCRRCPLYRSATHLVFGEGPPSAAMVLVGEQPGDKEDLAGHPFVGPAGELLDRALAGAAIDRSQVYVTNAVKHFKYEQRGKRRLHKRPNAYEVGRCRWWLDLELRLIRPKLIVALGVTAAAALAGRSVTITRERGRPVVFNGGWPGFITIHPSAILRMPDQTERTTAMELFIRDLMSAAALVRN